MANMDTGNLVTAQTIIDDKYQKPEMRMDPAPVTALLGRNKDFMIANLEEIRSREDRDFDVHLISRTKRNTGNERVHNHQGTYDDTMKVSPTFTTFSDKTSISLKLLDKSVFDFNRILANKIEQMMMNIMEDLEAYNQSWLISNRSQYSKALNLGPNVSFNEDNDAVEIKITDYNRSRFYSIMKTALERNNHTGMLDVFVDSQMHVEAEHMKAQGGGNSQNLSYQFSMMNFAHCQQIADENYTNGLVIATPAETMCMLDWIPRQNREGTGDYNTYNGGYGSLLDPWGYGLTFALHGYQERADTSAKNGSKQDDNIELELSLDTSNNMSPLSGAVGEKVAFMFGMTA